METPNHGYNAPQEGTTDWHQPLNENFKAFDTDVEIRDEQGHIEEYEPKSGAKFFAIDTGRTFVGEGDTWREVAAGPEADSLPSVRIAETAAEIQPAIDALAADVDDTGARGGVVQLGAKTYYPETTIWLKSGVTLQGARHTRGVHSRRVPHIGGGQEGKPIRSTVISTRDMATGANAYTHEHDRRNPHPHFPVISNYQAPPVVDGEANEFDETTDRYHSWGADIGLRNLVLVPEKKRYWNFGDHGADDVYNASRSVDGVEMTDRDWATYFGVYDGVLFEATTSVLVENVSAAGFDGYGALYKDVHQVLDRGSRWAGGSTDYHGSALSLDHSKVTHSWTRGTWDVDARGPTPTLELNSYSHSDFVGGAWSDQNINGQEHSFLGDEERFWKGNVPLTDTAGAESVVFYDQAHTRIMGYNITAPGRGTEMEGTIDGILLTDDSAVITECDVAMARSAVVSAGGKRHRIENSRMFRAKNGIECRGTVPMVDGVLVQAADTGFVQSSGHETRNGTINGLTLKSVDQAFEGQNNQKVYFNYPDFQGVGSFGDDHENLVINNPAGYENVDGFPDRHTPS